VVVSRDGTLLSRTPLTSRCTTVLSAQKVTVPPARSGPSQNCCPHTVRFPDNGTTRVNSTARSTGSAPSVGSCGAVDAAAVSWRAGVAGGSEAGSRSGGTLPPVRGMNRSAGNAMFSDWCGRLALYSCRNASIAAWAATSSGQTSTWSSSSCCRVWWNRSTFPVVVGDRGLVFRATMPFSRQIRSNITSAGRGRVNRPVNCLPLSVSTSSGIP
jgi:hypothetical protein